jgi:hypothetical protein
MRFHANMIKWVIPAFALATIMQAANAQDTSLNTACAKRDLADVIRKAMHKPPKVKSEKQVR